MPTIPDDPISLAKLAIRWKSYPRLLAGLCEPAGVPVAILPNKKRTRVISRRDIPRLRSFFATYRSFKGVSKGPGRRWHPIV